MCMSTVPLTPFDGTHQVRVALAIGHAVRDPHGARLGVEFRLEDERVGAVPAPCRENAVRRTGGRELPEAVVLVTEQPREARRGVEVGQAQPVDGPVEAHQGGRMKIADDGVVLDALRHGLILAALRRGADALWVRRACGDRSARDTGTGADGRVVLFGCLDPGQDAGRRQGVADVGIDGRAGEDDADDLPTRPHQRSARVAGQHGGGKGIDAAGDRPAVVDVLADRRDLLGHRAGLTVRGPSSG